MAASPGGNRLTFGHAMIGGCPLEKHVRLAEAFEKDASDPLGRPYARQASLRDLLEKEKWDYLTIQQLSTKSFEVESYRPWARTLHAGWQWRPRDGRKVLANDTHHAGLAGEYLGACVWFEFLYRQSVVGNSFVPPGLPAEDARFLQEAAHRVVTGQVRPANHASR